MAQQSYWDNTGKYQALYTQLEKLIPVSGKCEHSRSKNKKLEKLRTAGNAYYDIFNNGGMNRAADIGYHFGLRMSHYRVGRGREQRTQWRRISDRVDPIMDGIILAAAVEQGLIAPGTEVAVEALVA
jgi:hypothetical protein